MPPNPLSLKQKLAALSNAHSSPSPPHGVDSTPRSSSRRKFTAPWARQNVNESMSTEQVARDKVQDVMGKLIFQAGVDYEVVLCASALPDPREVNYDLLLSRILSYLNLYVESDYTVVFFTAGGKHNPGWNWVWRAYRSLLRKYRKNLKRLYIVHSTWFSKMLFSLAGAIISPKFFRKLVYIQTLSDLAYQVPLTQIDIPPAVYQENLKHEKQISLPTPTRSSIFGVPLEDLMGYNGEKGSVPRVVKDCIQYLRESGLEQDGLFRRSPNSTLLRQVQEAYDRGNVVTMGTIGDPHLAAVLLKKYLRDLPEAIFPEGLYQTIRRCPPPTDEPTDMSSVTYTREILLPELPPCAYILLTQYLHLMHEVSLRAASNRMDAHNLAVVLCPNLVSGTDPIRDVAMCAVPGGPILYDPASAAARSKPTPQPEGKTTLGAVIKLCIHRYYEIFDEVQHRNEAPQPWTLKDEPVSPGGASSASSGSRQFSGFLRDDEDDIDDGVLVMPIEPSSSRGPAQNGSGSISTAQQTALNASGNIPYKPRHRSNQSGEKSVHAVDVDDGGLRIKKGNGNPQPGTVTKAKSMVSIDNGDQTPGIVTRRGSISVGRRTRRKSSGAGVEAINITAGGFFTSPNSSPSVPSFPSSSLNTEIPSPRRS
ncbi:hypothetical protein PILCRDRAFT_825167 [Piloderma croceum F 1598]|uniref:Rho-GAP domain-containing protein n=1 Tax=Piloderma croceum (strain F 1598) TaxID=765440 RepID=A0A0C3EYW9_PILCF|nr:hypothetical protein PILCRDRAFT_825167 [Piloderma croceum F 1598]